MYSNHGEANRIWDIGKQIDITFVGEQLHEMEERDNKNKQVGKRAMQVVVIEYNKLE